MNERGADALRRRVAASLDRPVSAAVARLARTLGEEAGALAVLFYGSNLRSGTLEGVLDFYVLTPGPQAERIWPRVGYREEALPEGAVRAKIARMSMARFAAAAAGRSRDTTVWTRFVQPAALAWQRDAGAGEAVTNAVAAAVQTAARVAAALGPARASEEEYWASLFRATYRAELRVEKPGRERAILEAGRNHFAGLLPLAWEAQGIGFSRIGEELAPNLPPARRASLRRWWRRRERLGKPLNALRLVKASATFDGAADYAAYKLERHTGIRLPVTRLARVHPLLGLPGAAWTLWRARRRT